MSRRDKIQLRKLTALETEFRETLIPCLRECARGRWGLFGAYDHFPGVNAWIRWPQKDRLHELAASIQAIREEFGERNPLCDEFLALCAMHRANDPGEPKLATVFLERIERQNAKSAPTPDLKER